MSRSTPISEGPKAEPIWPLEMSIGTGRPPISTIRSPRDRPASNAGLSGNTCVTRISRSFRIVDRPNPMNWLSE
jgi:hypothetical protein